MNERPDGNDRPRPGTEPGAAPPSGDVGAGAPAPTPHPGAPAAVPRPGAPPSAQWTPPVAPPPAPPPPPQGAPPGAPAVWQQYPEPSAQPPRRGPSVGLVVVLVLVGLLVVAIIAVAFLASAGVGSFMAGRTPIEQVAVGQCFNGLTSGDTSEGTTNMQMALLFGVTVVDCAEPHDGELVARFGWPDGSEAYPGDAAAEDFSERECRALFADYVGIACDASVLELTYTYPLPTQWNSGSRSFECIVHPPAGGEQLSGSVRDSAADVSAAR